LERLREALHGQGRELEVIVAAEFLNEVIAHRRRAIDLVRDARLVRRETLKRHSLYFGQDGTNVFVGAYATAIGREGEVTESFKEWLDREAPYQTEAELADHLAAIGIRTESLLGSADDHERARVTRLHGALVAGYSERHRDKANVLIDHEARQLARLERLSGTDGTAVFVTADATLRSIASEHPEAATAGRLLLSSVGFVELIDFVAGLRPVHRSLARMLWGIRAVEGLDEQRETLRAYFTDLALTEYSSAIHFDLQRLVESYVEQTITDAAAERVKLAPSSEPDRASASKLLDRKADDFYRQMSAEIAERDRQQ
jgi:hypothetical protein